MKAEKMFKECGFKKYEENGEKIVFLGMYMPYAACAINFHLVTEEVSFSLLDDDFRFTPNLFRAIAKQMAELGWINLMWQSAASIKYDEKLDEKMYEPIHKLTDNNLISISSNSNDIYQFGKSKCLKKGTMSR